MNLAEIRKKAQKGDSGNGQAAPAPVAQAAPPAAPEPAAAAPAPPAPEPAAAAPVPEPAPPMAPVAPEPPLAEALAAFAAEFPAPEFDEPQAELPQTPWRSEPAASLPDEEDCDDAEEFDPAAVILKGRESAAFEEDAAQQDEVAVASVELLCFKVANEEYAISIMDIKEIIKPREVTEVPRVPSFVRGILSLRGNIIPIFDMRVRLGLAGTGGVGERERVVVVKRENGFAGVLVDEVVQVVRIPEGGVEPPPVVLEGIDREFVLGIGRVSGRMLILLDIEKVLDVGLL